MNVSLAEPNMVASSQEHRQRLPPTPMAQNQQARGGYGQNMVAGGGGGVGGGGGGVSRGGVPLNTLTGNVGVGRYPAGKRW